MTPARPAPRVLALTLLAMLAFAANSLLCRLALRHTGIDAASFTSVRIVSGAAVLALLARWRAAGTTAGPAGSWASALALFVYAAAFSFAYLSLSAATGALLLFGAVQVAMLVGAWRRGERFGRAQWVGLAVAMAGILTLLWPGLAAPPLASALLMMLAGVAWGVYSLRGARGHDPLRATAGNFLRAVPMALGLSAAMLFSATPTLLGLACAAASGALASGVGYAIWYAALRGLGAGTAASVQLSVPLLAALGGVVWLGEPFSTRLALAGVAVLGGVAVVVNFKR